MSRKHCLFVLAVIAFLSTAISAQVPDKAKVVAGADRAPWTIFARVVFRGCVETMTYTVGIDVGSTYAKALVLSADMRIAGRAMLNGQTT